MDGNRFSMLIDSFPNVSESFIVRQASTLHCNIVTGIFRRDVDVNFKGELIELGHHSRGFKPSNLQKLLSRVVPRSRSYRLSKNVASRLKIHWTENRPDAVLAEFGPNGIRAAQVCPALKIPFVIHFHGYDASALPRFSSYRSEIRHAIASCHSVVVVSSAMKEVVKLLGCPPEKIHIIPCGVPVDDFKSSDCIRKQPCHFVAVGRMIPKKAPLTTLGAFAICQQQTKEVKLTFIGDGPLFEQAKAFAREKQLNNVQLLGSCPNGVVKETLSNAACFLQHSMTGPDGNAEGWPVAIAEAMATGLPVISTNHAGIIDQVKHEITGFRTDEGDLESMGRYMTILANDPERRRLMGIAGRERIQRIGDVDQAIGRLKSVLTEAVVANQAI